MPTSSHLLSSLYQWQLRTTIPAKIQNTDPAALQVHEQIATCSNAFKSQADKWCKSLAPLYAGQPIAMYDTLHKIWIPTTVVCILPSTATKYTPAMVWSTATWDDTFVNTVSSQLKLFQTPQQPHCRLLPDLTSLHHSLHNWHNLCQLHPQHLWLWSHRPQLSPPCQLSQRLPLHPCLWHPMQPLCSPGDQVMPVLHPSAWFKRCKCPMAHGRRTWLGPSLDCHLVSCTLRHRTIRPMHVLKVVLIC